MGVVIEKRGEQRRGRRRSRSRVNLAEEGRFFGGGGLEIPCYKRGSRSAPARADAFLHAACPMTRPSAPLRTSECDGQAVSSRSSSARQRRRSPLQRRGSPHPTAAPCPARAGTPPWRPAAAAGAGGTAPAGMFRGPTSASESPRPQGDAIGAGDASGAQPAARRPGRTGCGDPRQGPRQRLEPGLRGRGARPRPRSPQTLASRAGSSRRLRDSSRRSTSTDSGGRQRSRDCP
jgi:hypothetical protein